MAVSDFILFIYEFMKPENDYSLLKIFRLVYDFDDSYQFSDISFAFERVTESNYRVNFT